MDNSISADQIEIDLAKIKERVKAVNDLPLTEHSAEFERIHAQLQQALTNLDGV
jgi:hypothetical protein